MSRLPLFTQQKLATSSTEASPSSSPDHFHRSTTERQSEGMDSASVRPKRHRGVGGGVHVWGDRDKVVLLVDNKRFSICPILLTRQPNTMLGRYS